MWPNLRPLVWFLYSDFISFGLFCPVCSSDSCLFCAAESLPPPPLTRSKRLRKRREIDSDETEEFAANPDEASGTDDELREAFEAVDQEKQQETTAEAPSKKKGKDFDEEVRLNSGHSKICSFCLSFSNS